MMRKILIHIGAGKCGSSALQSYLSFNPVLSSHCQSKKKIVYGIVGPSGWVEHGATVSERARSNVFQYASSSRLANITDNEASNNFSRSVDGIEFDVLVLSNEGWINEYDGAKKLSAALKDFEVEVCIYIRPPVQWINSAWWQWGAWCGLNFGDWLAPNISNTYWSCFIRTWQDIDFVDQITVRSLPDDIVQDFLNHYSISIGNTVAEKANSSLPGSVLRYFQEFNDLRSSPHESAIDFSLSRQLALLGSSTDWIVDMDAVDDIIRLTEEPNTSLFGFLGDNQLELIKNNPAWWSSEFYRSKEVTHPSRRNVTKNEVESLVYESLKALHKSEIESIQLKKEIRTLKNKIGVIEETIN